MNTKDLLIMSNRNLWRRKARTVLTCLGVLIGTAAIVVMISLGIGMRASMEESMAQWGSLNIINIYPGMQYDNQGNPTGEEKRLTEQTVSEFKAMQGVTAVSPVYNIWGGDARWGRKQGWISLVAIDPETMEDLEFTVAHGRLISPDDRFAMVAGSRVVQNFWDERDSRRGGMMNAYVEPDPAELLDQRIQYTVHNQVNYERKQNFNFFVVGILDDKNMNRSWDVYVSIHDIKRLRDFMFQGVDKSSSSMGRGGMVFYSSSGMAVSMSSSSDSSISSSSNKREEDRSNDYDSIMMRAKDVKHSKALSSELRDMGYSAWSMADSLEGIESFSRILQAVLGGIGGITLLVAALGISNTMIMSIYERTREIGIMKVIGASFSDVRSIFLMEAGLIGLFGGILGLGLSYSASWIINHFGASYIQQGMGMGMGMGGMTSNISIIPPWLAGFALVFAIFIGLAAGLYPAIRAIKVSPIVAIRNE